MKKTAILILLFVSVSVATAIAGEVNGRFLVDSPGARIELATDARITPPGLLIAAEKSPVIRLIRGKTSNPTKEPVSK